jgi:hypothetical protein
VTLSVCVAGATGWAGRPLAEAVLEAEEAALRGSPAASDRRPDALAPWVVGTAVPPGRAMADALQT